MSSEPDEKRGDSAAPAPSDKLEERQGGGSGESPAYDVVLVHGATGDGEGARVLRARQGHLEVGEIRPLRQGQPIAAGEVVRLVERPENPNFYDVKVDYKAPTPSTTPSLRAAHGPAQVATPAYRDSWERIFASKPRAKDLN
jgi:hypothetical protein